MSKMNSPLIALPEKEQYEKGGLPPRLTESFFQKIDDFFDDFFHGYSQSFFNFASIVVFVVAAILTTIFFQKIAKMPCGLPYSGIAKTMIWGMGAGFLWIFFLFFLVMMFKEAPERTSSSEESEEAEDTEEIEGANEEKRAFEESEES